MKFIAKRILIGVLASPIIVCMIAFDIIKFPLIVVFSPVWALMTLIDYLKGEETFFFELFFDISTMGFQMAKEILS